MTQPAPSQSGSSDFEVTIHRWHGVAAWTWEGNDVCAICHNSYDQCHPEAQFPGDDSPVVWGKCGHAFHIACINKYLHHDQDQNARPCPVCRRPWDYPFHAHSAPTDDAEDPTVDYVRREIYDLLSVEFVLEFVSYYRRRLLALLKQTRKLENLNIAYLISVLGCKFNALDLHQDAEKLHRRALCIGVKGLGRDHPDLTGSMEWLAFSLYRQGHFKEAVLLCYSMIILVHQSMGPSHPDLANCYFNLAMIVEAMGLADHASVLREKGLSLLKFFFPLHGCHYWWPVGKAETVKAIDSCWGYSSMPQGFYPFAEMHPAGMWIPPGYPYGEASFVADPVHSF